MASIRSLLRSLTLVFALLFLTPFILTLLLFSVILRKDEAHFSH